MTPLEQYTAFMTILRKEIRRYLRIWPQTLLPSAITMSLYFVIFGSLIGSRIGQMGGFTYMQFVVPGLIMMAIVTNSYSNVVSSFYGSKFQRHIEEMIISPTPNYIILIGYVLGGVARGLSVGVAVTLVSMVFNPLNIHSLTVIISMILLTSILFSLAGLAFGLAWQVALVIGLLLSLSSTAIVLQTFSERGLSGTAGGRSAFSVLLFQDIAVIPMLAVIPLLALPELMNGNASGHAEGHHEMSLVAGLDAWARALVVVAAIALVVVGGRFLSRPLFAFVARSGLREAFTAASLTLVIGVAVLMTLVGLSPALGTFLAGVVLANSEFRHELEANIEPFKGLLLGLFFITVGAGIDFAVLAANPAPGCPLRLIADS